MPFVFATLLWYLRRKNRRKRRSLKRLRRSQRPPPSPREPWDDGLLICVQLVKYEDLENVQFMRFNIPSKTLDNLLSKVKSECSEGVTCYVPHSHDAYKDPERFYEYSPTLSNGPFPFPLDADCTTCVINSEVFCLAGGTTCMDNTDDDNHLFHTIYSSDFAKEVPQWDVSAELSYHSYFPTMVPIGKQLYVFQERYNFEDDGDRLPLALVHEVHDAQPSKMLPPCTFDNASVLDLVVASLDSQLLIVDKIRRFLYYFHIEDFNWIPSNFTDFHPLLIHLSIMQGKPVTVTQYKTLCWVDKEDNIGAFNWENSSISVGPIIGFAHEVPPLHSSRPHRSLVQLKDELFGLIWVDSSSRLHITVLLICLEEATRNPLSDSAHLLTVSVVACFCYHLDFDGGVHAAYLLNRRDDQQAEEGVGGLQ